MLTLAELQLILAALNGAVTLGERIVADIKAAHAAGKPAPTLTVAQHTALKAAVAAIPTVPAPLVTVEEIPADAAGE